MFNGKLAHSMTLRLIEIETGEEVTCYFPAQKSKNGDMSVSRVKSKFSALYRLVTGNNPAARFSRSQQLIKHFIGYEFIVEYEVVTSKNQGEYRKAVTIKPVNPIVKKEWTKAGILKGKSRRAYSSRVKQSSGNRQASSGQSASNIVAIENLGEAHFNLGLPRSSTSPASQQANRLEHLQERGSSSQEAAAEFVTVVAQVSSKEKVFQYHQQSSESTEQYHERVIEESFSK